MRESIKDKVAIVGMGCSRFGERWDAGIEDLIREAAFEALQDAGIELKDVQAIWLGTIGVGATGTGLIASTALHTICSGDEGGECLRFRTGGLEGGYLWGGF